jgi:hypothetical protein
MIAFPSILYYASAALHCITIPKHTLVGLYKIQPAASTISNNYALQRKLITPTWLHANTWLITTGTYIFRSYHRAAFSLRSYVNLRIALLNIMWAQNGGPKNVFEKGIIWIQFAAGIVTGLPYFVSGMYAGLPMLWGGSACSLIAMLSGP